MENIDFKKKNLYLTKDEKEFIIETLKDIPGERLGIGQGKGHFGEYLQGHFDDIKGDIIDRACVAIPLISHIDDLNLHNSDEAYYQLPYASSGSIAIFIPSEDENLEVEPNYKILSKKAAEYTLSLLGKEDCGGLLKIITRGKTSMGLGTSTSDIVASMRAVSESFGIHLEGDLIAKKSVEIELASDGIMYDNATLFITTQGKILENYGVNYPEIEILGFNSNHTEKGIDTLDIPPRRYNKLEKKQLMGLRMKVGPALIHRDLKLMGEISISSAKVNQRFIEKPYLDEVVELASDNYASGVVVAHSGTMMGLMFAPQKMPPVENLSNIVDELKSMGFTDLKRYKSK